MTCPICDVIKMFSYPKRHLFRRYISGVVVGIYPTLEPWGTLEDYWIVDFRINHGHWRFLLFDSKDQLELFNFQVGERYRIAGSCEHLVDGREIVCGIHEANLSLELDLDDTTT